MGGAQPRVLRITGRAVCVVGRGRRPGGAPHGPTGAGDHRAPGRIARRFAVDLDGRVIRCRPPPGASGAPQHRGAQHRDADSLQRGRREGNPALDRRQRSGIQGRLAAPVDPRPCPSARHRICRCGEDRSDDAQRPDGGRIRSRGDRAGDPGRRRARGSHGRRGGRGATSRAGGLSRGDHRMWPSSRTPRHCRVVAQFRCDHRPP